MPVFTITYVGEPKELQAKDTYSAKLIYPVEIAEDTPHGKDFELWQETTTAPPMLGPIEAEIVPAKGTFKPRLKRAKKGFRGNGGGGYKEDPKKSAEIRRMASQKAAIALLSCEVAAGLRFGDQKASELLKPRIDFFEKDVEEAGRLA